MNVICSHCGRAFNPRNSLLDAMARKEMSSFKDAPMEQCSIVCEDCYLEALAAHKRFEEFEKIYNKPTLNK